MLPPVSASVLLPLSLLSLSFAPLPGPLPVLSALSGHSPFFFFRTPPALNLSARTLSRSSVIHLGSQHLSLSPLSGCFFRHRLTHSVLHASTVSWVSHSLLPSPLQDSLLRTCHPICVLGFSLMFRPGCSVTSGGRVSPHALLSPVAMRPWFPRHSVPCSCSVAVPSSGGVSTTLFQLVPPARSSIVPYCCSCAYLYTLPLHTYAYRHPHPPVHGFFPVFMLVILLVRFSVASSTLRLSAVTFCGPTYLTSLLRWLLSTPAPCLPTQMGVSASSMCSL